MDCYPNNLCSPSTIGSDHLLFDDDFIGEISFLANPFRQFGGHIRYAPVDEHHNQGHDILEHQNKGQPSCYHVPVIRIQVVFVFEPERFSRVPISKYKTFTSTLDWLLSGLFNMGIPHITHIKLIRGKKKIKYGLNMVFH